MATTGYFKITMTVAVQDYYPDGDPEADHWTTTALEWFSNILEISDPKQQARALREFRDSITEVSEEEMRLIG